MYTFIYAQLVTLDVRKITVYMCVTVNYATPANVSMKRMPCPANIVCVYTYTGTMT